MCVVAIPIILAVASAAAAVYSANQQRHAVEDQMKQEQKQTNEAASAQTEDRMRAAREQRAAARAASAESGVTGNSADAVISDIQMQSGRDVSRIEKNRENGIAESTQQARARGDEINGQLTQSLISSASSAYSGARTASK
jgi:cytoskeletal protein RodZ